VDLHKIQIQRHRINDYFILASTLKNKDQIKHRMIRYKQENSELIHQKDKQRREQRKKQVIGEYSNFSYNT